MVRLLFWGILIYLGWKAWQVVKDSLTVVDDDREINGKSEDSSLDIDEDDIMDADFKDLKD